MMWISERAYNKLHSSKGGLLVDLCNTEVTEVGAPTWPSPASYLPQYIHSGRFLRTLCSKASLGK